jgi:hypothetical protein
MSCGAMREALREARRRLREEQGGSITGESSLFKLRIPGDAAYGYILFNADLSIGNVLLSQVSKPLARTKVATGIG